MLFARSNTSSSVENLVRGAKGPNVSWDAETQNCKKNTAMCSSYVKHVAIARIWAVPIRIKYMLTYYNFHHDYTCTLNQLHFNLLFIKNHWKRTVYKIKKLDFGVGVRVSKNTKKEAKELVLFWGLPTVYSGAKYIRIQKNNRKHLLISEKERAHRTSELHNMSAFVPVRTVGA